MQLKTKLKDYIGILYYRHGLFCASNPISCLLLVFSVLVLCCYPLKNLQSFSSSLEQYKQPIHAFDGLEANAEINEFIEYERLADRPAWYNRVPIAYIQRIVVKSVINIPKSLFTSGNTSGHGDDLKITTKLNISKENRLYLIDAFRTPLTQLFELNDFVRNFQTTKHPSGQQKSLIGDLCVHVGELGKDDKLISKNLLDNTQFNKHFLPEFNCLYLSPANFWSNNLDEFSQDDDLMQTINFNLNQQTLNLDNQDDMSHTDEEKSWTNLFLNLYNRITSDNYFLDKKRSTNLRELLFGVSWSSTLKSLNDDLKLSKELNNSNSKIQNDLKNSKSIVMTYAITIALRKYDKEFLDELKEKLNAKFGIEMSEISTGDGEDNFIYNLQYTRQSFVYYIPYLVLYFLLFLYIYISVRKIEFVKSKWGLAFAAVSQVVASLLMSIGICSYFGLTPTLNGGEIFPYLIIFIGFENIVVLTKSVVSTPFDLDVRYRIALGLKKESWVITKILTFELIIIFFGILTMVPAIQEFCVFAYVGLLIDFFMQMIFFVTVLSIDIRRMELSDLNKKLASNNSTKTSCPSENGQICEENLIKHPNITYRGASIERDFEDTNHNHSHTNSSRHYNKKYGLNYGTFFMNKSVQFFYFWARTRLVQRALITLSVLWIILIFYKSLLVVELMRYDVNVKKETVEALLPKGVGLPKLLKDNFQHILFTSTSTLLPTEILIEKSRQEPPLPVPPESSTIDYLRRHFQNFLIMSTMNMRTNQNNRLENNFSNYGTSTKSSYTSFESKKQFSLDDLNWQSLSYYHWLTLFAYYNVSLYNRYVAILPQINLYKIVKQSDILKFRNVEEIRKYNSVLSMDNQSKLILENISESSLNFKDTNSIKLDSEQNKSLSSALVELVSIVILGIPTIFLIVYILTLLYKFLCSKKYEEWSRSWSTSNIKKQYKIIHSKQNRSQESDDSDFDEDQQSKSSSESSEDTNQNETNTVTLNKIINGQKDDIQLVPFKLINCKHEYPLDLISTSSNLFATSDLANRINIWSLEANRVETENDLIKSIALNQGSIWSMTLTDDDQFILIGLADGILKIINILTNKVLDFKSKNSSGITHLNQIKSTLKQSQTNLLVQTSPECLILVSRLSGFIELVDLSSKNASLICTLRAHHTPITNLFYPNIGDYFLTTGQDYLLKVIKIKPLYQNTDKELNIMFELIEHGQNQITSMSIDKENTINAATGSQDGAICLWNLFTGECKFKLKNMSNNKKDQRQRAIIKLELTQNILVSLSSDQQMCIWNRVTGVLIKEFEFFAPCFMSDKIVDSDPVVSSSILSKISGFLRENTKKSSNLIKNENSLLFQPVPTMCLYSKTILITGGCSCIFLWNVQRGELIKKINIKNTKPINVVQGKNRMEKYSHMNVIKEIRLIRCKASRTLTKLLLLTDYTDSIYILKIPFNVIQSFD